MWTKLAGTVLLIGSGAAYAQSAEQNASQLQACFQAAHFADLICSKIVGDPPQRLECLKKSSADQLDCLEHAVAEAPSPTPPAHASDTAQSEPPANAPETPAPTSAPKQPDRTASSDKAPEHAAETSGSDGNSKDPSNANAKAGPPETPVEAPTGAVRADPVLKTADRPTLSKDTDWVVSETTSPIDYSPLVTAVIHSVTDAKDKQTDKSAVAVPNIVGVRCRAQHTELLMRTDGAWSAPRGNELQVEYQVNDQPAVRLPWVLSADGKTATCKGDPVELLQSLPDGARLKIRVADRASPSRETTFRLDGLDTIRKKIAAACKWAPDSATASRR
jgi:hypothetical protein